MIDFSFKGSSAKDFKTLIDVVQGIVTGPRKFDFYPDKIVMASMENSSSVFVMFEIKKSFFDSYNVESEMSLGLSIDDLKKVFSRNIKDNATIKFSYSSTENRMLVTFDEERSNVEYKLNVHVPEEEHTEIVNKVKAIPLGCGINLEGGHLKNLLSDVGVVAQKDSTKQLAIKVSQNKEIVFELKSDQTGINAKSVITTGDGSPIESITSDEDQVQGYYDMDYLEKLFKIDAISNKAKMELASEHPLRLTFTAAGGAIEFIYLMAPLETETE